MTEQKKNHPVWIDFLGLIAFFAIYKLSPEAIAVRNAAIGLLFFTVLQFIYYRHLKIKVPRYVAFLNIFTIIMAIPTIYFNDLIFLRYKLLIIKGLFFFVPFGFILFKKNFFTYFFGEMPGLEKFTSHQFNIINLWYLVVSGISLPVTIYGVYFLNDADFITLKSIWLPLVGHIYIAPIVYYSIKQVKAEIQQANHKE